MTRAAAFAIPGEITTVTGGYIYERRLLESLRELGHDVTHLALDGTFPDPTPQAMAEAVDALIAVEPNRPVILDGLVFGAIETEGLARVRAPILAMIHHPLALETGLTPARRDHLFRTERDNLALAAHVLVPSPHTARILTDRYGVAPDRITVAPPGSDRRPSPRSPTQPPLILSVGLLHPRKGHDVLIRALDRISDLDWRAVIVGAPHDPVHAKALAQMVRELGLGDRIRLAGLLPQADLDALYTEASLFALATRYEGYGMVLDEALLFGLPIVTCATGAVPDTVPTGAGRLVPPDDPSALAGALAELLGDAPLRHRLALASAQAGQALPRWRDTAGIASAVLERLP